MQFLELAQFSSKFAKINVFSKKIFQWSSQLEKEGICLKNISTQITYFSLWLIIMYIWFFFSMFSLILRYISSSWYQPTPYRSKVRSNFDRWIVCFTTRVINSVSEHFPTRDEQIYILSAPRWSQFSENY